MGNEQREEALGVREAGKGKHTHIHCVPRDTEGGRNLGQGRNTISTHVGVASHQIN